MSNEFLAFRVFLHFGLFLLTFYYGFIKKGIPMEKLGYWTSDVDRLEYEKAYGEALLTMPIAKSVLIETSFGTIQTYCWQNKNTEFKKPILLLPGRSSGTPMWSTNIHDLVKDRTVYAFDALGDAGLSIQKKEIKDSLDQSLWINETVEKLGLSKVHIIGHSFGGWLAANYATQYPEKVFTLSLLEPVFTFRYIKLKLI